MVSTDSKYRRSFTVLAVVVACFAVLWPKVFYPMVQSVFIPTDDDVMQNNIRSPNFHKMIHPHIQEALGEARPPDKRVKDSSRAWIHPSVRHSVRPHSKSAGAVNLLVPVYTIGIIIFFAYTALKMLTAEKPQNEMENSVITNHEKIAGCLSDGRRGMKKGELLQTRRAQRALQQYGKEKVITALKAIILEMEDFKENLAEFHDLMSEINLDSDGHSPHDVSAESCLSSY